MSYRPLINRTKRSLASIKQKLLALSADWEDLDEFVRAELERSSTTLDEIVDGINEEYPPRRTVRRQP